MDRPYPPVHNLVDAMGSHKKLKTREARDFALSILNTLNAGGQTLDALLCDVDEQGVLDPRERGFLNALVYGVLRWRGHLDWMIGQFSRTRLKQIDPVILNILRLGLFQMHYLDRVPPSAAVNTAVELAKKNAPPWVVKFVNAVLRKLASGHASLPDPAASRNDAHSLSAGKSLPQWLVARWLHRFGPAETRALCDAINEIPSTTVRTNTLKTNRGALLGRLADEAAQLWPTRYSPEGISFTKPKSPIGQMGAFLNGEFQVQDEAAQLVGHILAPQPGETILDACAGLGGKTGHMAQLMKNHGRIDAMDINEQKLKRLSDEIHRLGADIVTPVVADLTTADKKIVKQYDRILLDAPCSGLGVLRRNPDTKWSVAETDLNRCRRRQSTLLKQLAPRVKPNGVMVYAVCSTEPEENESVVDDFLSEHGDFEIDPPDFDSTLDQTFFTPRGCFRTFPHRHRMDGFFCARFRRTRHPES